MNKSPAMSAWEYDFEYDRIAHQLNRLSCRVDALLDSDDFLFEASGELDRSLLAGVLREAASRNHELADALMRLAEKEAEAEIERGTDPYGVAA